MPKNLFKSWNRNLLPKFIALLLAIVGWFIVMENINETTTRVFSDIPVQLEGIEELSNNDLIIGDIDNPGLENPTIDVTVQGQWRDIRSMQRDDITLRANIRTTRRGTVIVPIDYTLKNNSIIVDSLSQRSLQIVLDQVEVLEKDFQLVLVGDPPEGITVGDITQPQTVSVQGPSKILETIAYVSGTLDTSKYEESYTHYIDKKDLLPLDANGNVVSSVQIEDSYVQITVPYLTVKTVPVKLVYDGITNNRYGLTEAKAEPETIDIQGQDTLLEDIEEVATIQLNIGNYENDVELPAIISLPTGVSRADQAQVKAVFKISPYETKIFQFRREDIALEDESDEYQYEIVSAQSSVSVNIRDTREVLAGVVQDDLKLSVNVQNMDVATWTPSVKVTGAPASSVVTISPETVQLRVLPADAPAGE